MTAAPIAEMPGEPSDVATRTSHPGRTLVIFLAVVIAMFASVAALGNWKPKLGLDLQGGERIVLQAQGAGGSSIDESKLTEAADIISSRVNGAGISESDVSTQGSDIIIVEIPGKPDKNLKRSLDATAQLRFRLVAQQINPVEPAPTSPPTSPPATGSSGPSGTDAPSQPPASPSGSAEPPSGQTPGSSPPDSQSAPPSDPPSSDKGAGRGRVAGSWLLDDAAAPTTAPPVSSPGTEGSSAAAPTATPSPTSAPADPEPSGAGTGGEAPAPTGGPPPALLPPELEDIPDPYAWVAAFRGGAGSSVWLQRLQAFDCKPDGTSPGEVDIPSQPLLACDNQGFRYLLGPSQLDGTEVTDASAGIPQGQLNYAVNVEFNGEGGRTFGEITTRIAENSPDPSLAGSQLAIVLDGEVLSAPVNSLPITGGSAEISGSSADPFTQEQAQSLANSLKYGALPLSFSIVQATTEGPQLASNQLNAGVVAGIVGLLLVVLYCLAYYRGLGLVVIASLLIAGAITYASVLLLGEAYGFTLTLPGIAGLIVAVGITADSFIVYFERLRDEVRDGRTLRSSVETGWVRARSTILAADAVSMLAAVVLFIFAIGVVKGFAFALGLTTFIDVFVVFFFTKPMVTLLSRTTFFGQGHKWSGLDRQHLGMPALAGTPRAPRPVGGDA